MGPFSSLHSICFVPTLQKLSTDRITSLIPMIHLFIDFNPPYSFLSAIRIYQIYNKGNAAIKKPDFQYILPSAYSTHPKVSKVRIELRTIGIDVVMEKKTGYHI
ncbi:hypothetical protein BB558_001564 [Smittium angustum]|uniref:Uncharacterized protein n=1 Tax=Smittium angustum TaxID=133377 RepID=A0A2U1JB07_SMIAN|nr:hypothetical protein BB558_001564 [Smittium angustum]